MHVASISDFTVCRDSCSFFFDPVNQDLTLHRHRESQQFHLPLSRPLILASFYFLPYSVECKCLQTFLVGQRTPSMLHVGLMTGLCTNLLPAHNLVLKLSLLKIQPLILLCPLSPSTDQAMSWPCSNYSSVRNYAAWNLPR